MSTYDYDKDGATVTLTTDAFDPVVASASALEHGRIGRVAWALFSRGDGHVLSLDKGDGTRLLIEIDTPPERRGARLLKGALDRHVPNLLRPLDLARSKP